MEDLPELSHAGAEDRRGQSEDMPASLGLTKQEKPYEVFTESATEIVIALVGPLGTDNEKIRQMIADRLQTYGYRAEVIRFSAVIIPALVFPHSIPSASKYRRAKALIDFGNKIREESNNRAILAIAAVAEIARRRSEGSVQRVAYIISSLKLPEEVAELRKVYGNGFYLLAVHSDQERRLQNLSGDGREMQKSEALELITRDEHEDDGYGQNTRETFHLADFFVADEKNDDKLRYGIWRCLDLIFADPFITPTFNEYAMFMAFAASVRSGDLSRQVGAVVARGNELLSTGANDCPSAGGGLYWPVFIGDRVDDSPLGRDFKRGFDSNAVEKNRMIEDIAREFPEGQRDSALKILRKSRIKDITEYGRVVHAEMEAIIACARNNISSVGATIYCTTFPCHNCAKHIIASGIEQVVYVEPYPKSKALQFHDDSATLGKLESGERKVRFKPFIGVGPRQFFSLFSLSMSSGRKVQRKTDDGKAFVWSASGATPRLQMLPVPHRRFEQLAAEYLKRLKGTSP